MTFYWTFSTVGGALLSGRFNCWPVEPGSIRITCGSKVVTDDGDGFFIGDGSGPVDYDYGFFDLEFDPPSPPSGTPVVAAYEPVEGDCVDECNKCKISEWQGKEIALDLHHKNGNGTDNRLENLTFLCPNCHSQTKTYRGKNKNK